MVKILSVVIAIILIMLVWFSIRFLIGGGEDSWIKDSRGVYIKHGNPSQTPDDVLEQQNAVDEALQLYQEKKQEEMQFNSQCLGSVGDYAVDIVNVPRSNVDNLIENQCEDYRNGALKYFIELDKNGEIVRIE